MAAAPRGTDRWALFLRERRMKDKLRRLRNDFKGCYCPPGCRGGPQNHVGVDPASVPAQARPGPHVRADSDMPMTRYRSQERRHASCEVRAEARGTSDILLYRSGQRATLRMSLQVHTDVSSGGRVGHYAEMFLTRHGHPEEFVGLIESWLVDRTSDEWEDTYLGEHGGWTGSVSSMRVFMQQIYGQLESPEQTRPRDENGRLLPDEGVRGEFSAPWAMLSEDTDILYINTIWISTNFTRQRIVDQAFELFYRLMTGGTLPYLHNVDRPLTVLLEPGLLKAQFENEWRDPSGSEMNMVDQINAIVRAYVRNGFMRLSFELLHMGRRIEPGDHPAAPGDVNIDPPAPPDTDLSTPSPLRDPTAVSSQSPESPSRRRRRRDRLPDFILRQREEREGE
ncbi:hypothetical protein SLS64_012571 [Diaporthe eres]|uniref:Uncharacterized protein n=1 Tax=Diaporthe eres TaxID=83184 RepID=A0ABR1PFA0_DIAER